MERLTLKEYHRLAMRTSPKDGHDQIDNGVLGLLGETGELVDLYKKWVYQSEPNTPFPFDEAVNELGDILWYLEELASGHKTTMNAISTLTFAGLDKMTSNISPLPPMRRVIVNLSGHAHKIRRAADKQNWPEMENQMRRMMYCAAWMARLADVSIEEVAARNVEKLSKRYPDGFNAKISMDRYK
jgi:NTP pyrophosphatase (non-canonical NTP hydrolase)